jgi:hypothetical protein
MKEYLINRSDTPAFPLHNHGTQTLGMHFTGMTLRDYFAAQAMQGLIASPRGTPDGKDATDTYYAKCAYLVADAMMKAREK